MWKQQKLGEVAKLKNGFAFKSKDYSDEGTPVIRISDIKDNLVTTTEAKRVPMENEHEGYKIEEGSILIAMSGATTGKFGIYKSKEVALQNQRVGKFVYDEDKITNKFLYYLLYNLKRKILKEAYGGAQPNISSKKIEEMEVNLPSPPAQHRIVEKIEELFSDLDNGIENLKKARQQLETYKQSVLKAAFEGKLTAAWREQQDDMPTPEELKAQIEKERKRYREQQLEEWDKEVEEWQEQGKPGRKPSKPRKNKITEPFSEDEIQEFPDLPNKWQWVKFDKVNFIETNLVDPADYQSYPHVAPNYIEKMTGRLMDYSTIEEDGVKSKKHLFFEGQIIYSKIRPYLSKLIIAPFDGLCSADMYPIESVLNTKYIYYYMLSDTFLNQASSAGSRLVLPKINQKELGIVAFPLCSNEEQKQIVETLESYLSVIDNTLKSVKSELKKAKALRQSILKKAFEGELVSQEISEKEFQKPLQKYYKNTATDLHAGLMAKIISLHHQNDKYLNKLNHVKCEKNIHMIESHLGVDLQRQPVKDAAGPDDYTRLKKIEHRANRKNWFAKDTKLGGEFGYGYKPKKSINYAISNLSKVENLPMQGINDMINLFLPMSKEQAEVVATLYAAWNNFLLENYEPTDDEIVQAARKDWSKQKLKIKRHRFVKALSWIREKELTPSGKGKYVKDKTEN